MPTSPNKLPAPVLMEAFRYGVPGKCLSIFLVFVFLNSLGGCSYYKVVASEGPYPEVISAQQEAAKFIILHAGEHAWKFSDIIISNDTVAGKISPLLGHEYYKTTSHKKANRYKARPEKGESEVINEVHIFTSEYQAAGGNEISIPFENIAKIEIYDKDLGTGGLVFIVTAIPIIVVLFFVLWLSTDSSFS